MISFYPGPSRLYNKIPAFMQEACDKGVLSINHRSPEFVEISKKTISLFKQKLNVPEEYTLELLKQELQLLDIYESSYSDLIIPSQKKKCNVKYAFIHMNSPSDVEAFYKKMNVHQWIYAKNAKRCKLRYSL